MNNQSLFFISLFASMFAVPLASFSVLALLLHFRLSRPRGALQRGDFETAKKLYETAIQKTPGKGALNLWLELAHCQIKLGEPESALVSIDRAIALDPKLWVSYLNRASAACDCCKYQEALNDCQRALSLGCPEKFLYARPLAHIAMKNIDEALADCDRLEALSRGNELVSIHLIKSAISASSGNFDQAIRHCDNALKLDPHCIVAMIKRGHYYTALGELNRASADLQSAEALKCAPREAIHLMCGKAQLAIKERDINSALTYAGEALNKHPNSPHALFSHGLALARSGDAARALVDLDRAVSIDPYSGESYWARSEVHEALSQFEEAAQDKQNYERLGYRPYL